LSLFGEDSGSGRKPLAARGLICLAGRIIEYRFSRSRRRSLAVVVGPEGLSVRAPLRAAWREVEAFVREKERWIVAKLDAWAAAPRSRRLRGADGEVLPLFGTPMTLAVRSGAPDVRQAKPGCIVVTRPDPDRGSLVAAQLVAWLKCRALEALGPRTAHYAARLGLHEPRVALSNARLRWGVCLASGAIRLNWRLVHVEPALADYVVAHEVAHLVEMNHSTRFWSVVETLYPDWRNARVRLELAGASLPMIGERR
jgi:predicted metal-dependent hydrolase